MSEQGPGGAQKPGTASEARKAYEERLRTDPEFRAQREALEAERQTAIRRIREAQKPIVKDLRAAGYDVSSVQDLYKLPEAYPDVIPMLIKHLERRGYPDVVMEMVGRRLAVKLSTAQWDTVAGLYVRARGEGEKTGLAVALSEAARPERFDELVRLLLDPKLGETRIFFVRTVQRLKRQRGREILAALADDPVLGREVRAALKLS